MLCETRRAGYTLIEMLVVMAVLGILATATMPVVELTVKRNKERELKQALQDIRHGLDAYKAMTDTGRVKKESGASGYPPDLQSLVTGIPDNSVGGQMMYLLRRIPKDPFAPAATKPEDSWGLRSYASPPDKPQPGADVFDVYSKSEGVGMNGVPYKEW